MKILSVIALSALALSATAQSYHITGKADEKSEGKMVYLIDQNTLTYADSCAVKDGAFEFKGDANDQCLFELNINKNRRNKKIEITI